MYSQKHTERLYAAFAIMLMVSIAVTIILAISGSYAWDAGFAAGQEYEAWFCSNTVTP